MEKAKNIIQKVKIKDGQLEAIYEEHFSSENYSNTITKKCSQIIHADFRDAVDMLKTHMVIVCEMPEAEVIKDVGIYDYSADELANYIVTGYSHGGSDESAGVVIVGQKLLKSGKVLNLITPFIQFEDSDAYMFAGELEVEISACDHEAIEYLFNEKYGIKQMSLDFDTPAEADIATTAEEAPKPKKRGRKKKEVILSSFDAYA